MKNFKDKVVVVTGAGSGMGRAYAKAFAARGARLALNDYDADGLAETVAELGRGWPDASVHAAAFDVSDRDAMMSFAAEVQTTLGKAHVIINNAGIEGAGRPVWATTQSDYERIFQINFFGVVHGTQAFLPQLLANGEGAIVNVSSIFGLIGPPNSSDYSATKFAVRGFTESLMNELRETPLSVHLVHPGGIATNIARADHTRAFSSHYLTTAPEDIVEHVIKAVGKGTLRIVYGNGALKTHLGALFVPLKWLNRLIWQDMKDVIDKSDYPPRP